MRKSTAFFSFIALGLIVIALLYIQSRFELSWHNATRKEIAGIVKILKLTDMVLSTDARYTRHPSQADLFSAFQDYPCSIEHFPTGSVIPPPDFNSIGTKIVIKNGR